MSIGFELPQSGTVTTQVVVNLRQGAPRLTAPVIRKLSAGASIDISAVAIGDTVQGNAKWYRTTDGSYIWSGACSEVTAPSPPENITAARPSTEMPGATDYSGKLGGIPLVIDISHGDRVTSFKDAKAAGVVGIIHKATTGATGRTDRYAERRQQAAAEGLLWGAYHWGTAADVAAQVDNFLTHATPDANTLMALDFEDTPGNQMTLQDCKDFCQMIIDKTHRKMLLYSGSTLKNSHWPRQ